MATGPFGIVVGHLRRAALLQGGADLTDGELLECFLARRDEAAFAALLRRHGPMVLGVCRRVLRNEADAEDAFQATFLVLVRKAASVVPRQRVGNWLYGVAYHTALKARAMNRKRRAHERRAGAMAAPAAPAEDWQQLQALLDEELSLLPDKYRIPIVLCELEGTPLKTAARQLDWPLGTVASRLARARALLAGRLARRGVTLAGGALAAVLCEGAATACVPPPLAVATVQAAALVAADKAVPAGVISAPVAALTEGVVKGMFLTKLKVVTAVLVTIAAAGLIGGGLVLSIRAAEGDATPPVVLRQATLANPEDEAFKKALLEMETRLWQAGARYDVEAMRQIYADDFLGVSPLGRSDKAANLGATARVRTIDATIRNVEILRVNQDAALVTYIVSWKTAARDGTLVEERVNRRISNCWVRRAGRWQFLFSQETVLPGGK
jgi:RNA polymerase sigma factor (sigma-70 family)